MPEIKETRTPLDDPCPKTDPDNPAEDELRQSHEAEESMEDEIVTPASPESEVSGPESEADPETASVVVEPVTKPVLPVSEPTVPVKPVVSLDVRDINLTSNPKNPVEGISNSGESRLSMVGSADSQDPKNLAQALQSALSQAAKTKPRTQAWLDLTQELFTAI